MINRIKIFVFFREEYGIFIENNNQIELNYLSQLVNAIKDVYSITNDSSLSVLNNFSNFNTTAISGNSTPTANANIIYWQINNKKLTDFYNDIDNTLNNINQNQNPPINFISFACIYDLDLNHFASGKNTLSGDFSDSIFSNLNPNNNINLENLYYGTNGIRQVPFIITFGKNRKRKKEFINLDYLSYPLLELPKDFIFVSNSNSEYGNYLELLQPEISSLNIPDPLSIAILLAASCLLQQRNTWTIDQHRQALRQCCNQYLQHTFPTGWNINTGYGTLETTKIIKFFQLQTDDIKPLTNRNHIRYIYINDQINEEIVTYPAQRQNFLTYIFKWKNKIPLQNYQLVIAKDERFTEIIKNVNTQNNTTHKVEFLTEEIFNNSNLDKKEVILYWQVSAKDTLNRTFISKTRKLKFYKEKEFGLPILITHSSSIHPFISYPDDELTTIDDEQSQKLPLKLTIKQTEQFPPTLNVSYDIKIYIANDPDIPIAEKNNLNLNDIIEFYHIHNQNIPQDSIPLEYAELYKIEIILKLNNNNISKNSYFIYTECPIPEFHPDSTEENKKFEINYQDIKVRGKRPAYGQNNTTFDTNVRTLEIKIEKQKENGEYETKNKTSVTYNTNEQNSPTETFRITEFGTYLIQIRHRGQTFNQKGKNVRIFSSYVSRFVYFINTYENLCRKPETILAWNFNHATTQIKYRNQFDGQNFHEILNITLDGQGIQGVKPEMWATFIDQAFGRGKISPVLDQYPEFLKNNKIIIFSSTNPALSVANPRVASDPSQDPSEGSTAHTLVTLNYPFSDNNPQDQITHFIPYFTGKFFFIAIYNIQGFGRPKATLFYARGRGGEAAVGIEPVTGETENATHYSPIINREINETLTQAVDQTDTKVRLIFKNNQEQFEEIDIIPGQSNIPSEQRRITNDQWYISVSHHFMLGARNHFLIYVPSGTIKGGIGFIVKAQSDNLDETRDYTDFLKKFLE